MAELVGDARAQAPLSLEKRDAALVIPAVVQRSPLSCSTKAKPPPLRVRPRRSRPSCHFDQGEAPFLSFRPRRSCAEKSVSERFVESKRHAGINV